MKIADIFNNEVRKKIFTGINKKIKSVFPSPDSLYSKEIVKKYDIIHSSLNNTSIQTINSNNSSQINSNYSKKKYYEEDINTNANNNGNSYSNKGKKAVGKLQYREKIISSTENNNVINNSEIFSNFIDLEKSKFDTSSFNIEKQSKNIILGNNNLNNQIINEADVNSNETTSTSSKDDKQSEILISNKKEENNLNELIDIIKFDSGKLSGFSNENNSKNYFGEIPQNICGNERPNIKKLFSCRESSRFEFANRNIEKISNINNSKIKLNDIKFNETVEVPDFVFEIINKKVSRHNFTKNLSFFADILYKDSELQKEYKNSNHWAQFILDNKNIDTDKELIYDFEIINKSLKDKFKTYYLK